MYQHLFELYENVEKLDKTQEEKYEIYSLMNKIAEKLDIPFKIELNSKIELKENSYPDSYDSMDSYM